MPGWLAGLRSFPPSPPVKAGCIGGQWFANAIRYYRYHQPLFEPHFNATSWVIGELLKFNSANWWAFPLEYKVFNKYNYFVNVILLNQMKEKRNNLGKKKKKKQERESFLLKVRR